VVQRQGRAGFGQTLHLVVMGGEQAAAAVGFMHRLATARCEGEAIVVDVPRPTSSRITKLRGPACCRIAAVSTISTMNVERPRARLSLAPTR
jgi:hypothetical protein